MKPLTIYLILFVLVLPGKSQNNHSSSTTMFLNHIYYQYRPDSLTSLEQSTARMESKTKAMGYGGSEGGFYMEGAKSNLRIHADDSVRFVVKMNMAMMDPSMMIKLYKFESRKGNREAIISSQGGMFSGGKSKPGASEISFNVQKSGTEDYVLVPASRLAPGEYAFLNLMMVNGAGSREASYTVFAFGIY